MISASKTTFSHYNLKIFRPEVTKNIKNLRKKFCEFRPCDILCSYAIDWPLVYQSTRWEVSVGCDDDDDISSHKDPRQIDHLYSKICYSMQPQTFDWGRWFFLNWILKRSKIMKRVWGLATRNIQLSDDSFVSFVVDVVVVVVVVLNITN